MTAGTVSVGVDPSSKRIAAVMLEQRADARVRMVGACQFDLLPKGRFRPQRLEAAFALLMASMARLLAQTESVGAETGWWVEAPVHAGNSRALKVQSYASGVCLLAGLRLGFDQVDEVSNTAWKRTVVGDGGADKSAVAEWLASSRPDVYSRLAAIDCLPDGSPSQDLIDACGVSAHGLRQLRASGVDG